MRVTRTVVGPSIFTSRNGKRDVCEYVSVTPDELHLYGGSRDETGKCWVLNSIVAEESGEILRAERIRVGK